MRDDAPSPDGGPSERRQTKAYSWGQLSRLPLEEAGKMLGTFSAKGFSSGVGGGGYGGAAEEGGVRGRDADDGGDRGDDGDSFEDDLYDSDTYDENDLDDVDSSEGLMFELEI